MTTATSCWVAGITFTDLIESELIQTNVPILAEAASSVAGPQIRNVATIGGNICNGAPSADAAAPLYILNAVVELQGPNGRRKASIKDFYLGPGRVDRQQNEIMVRLRLPADDFQGWTAHYHKYAMREAMDIPTIGCAVACQKDGQRLAGIRLAYAVAGPTPLRCPKTEEKVKGMILNQDLLAAIGESVLEDLKPRDSWRASKEFREHIIITLAKRLTAKCLGLTGA